MNGEERRLAADRPHSLPPPYWGLPRSQDHDPHAPVLVDGVLTWNLDPAAGDANRRGCQPGELALHTARTGPRDRRTASHRARRAIAGVFGDDHVAAQAAALAVRTAERDGGMLLRRLIAAEDSGGEACPG